jgi:hypothetical protein
MEFIRKRLELGRSKYGHGVRTRDNPQTWGTDKDSWYEMAEEEFADGVVYVVADYIRNFETPSEDGDDNGRILQLLESPALMVKSDDHRRKVETLMNLISV